MTAVEWDKVGDRRFETGVDRGVLYLTGTLPGSPTAVPWNGLTSVSEDRAREVKSYYIDGVKYLDHQVLKSYAAKLQAFTYPDELEAFLGVPQFAPGVHLHDQRAKPFSLSYRTKIGNDMEGTDYGYKIHLLYNVMAVSSATPTMSSIGGTVAPGVFEWSLTGTPSAMFGIRPTSHVSLDSHLIDPDLLAQIETLIYGSDIVDPSLPDLVDLLALVEATLA